MQIMKYLRNLGIASLMAFAALTSWAQNFPTKPVKIVVAYPAGGGTDLIARSLSQALASRWGVPVIVDNRAGASGIIGTNAVAKAPADGYTMLVTDSAPLVILPFVKQKLPYSPLAEFAPIAVVARQTPVLVVGSKIPVKSVEELVAYAKSNTGMSYGSSGTGSYFHIGMEQFLKMAGIKMLHVPYKGTAQIMTDLISGQIDMAIGTLASMEQHDKAGKLKILALTTDARVSLRPDFPTVAESGFPEYSLPVWFGLVAPAETPASILDQIHSNIAEILKDQAFIEHTLRPQFLVPGRETRTAFGNLLKTDSERWRNLVKDLGIPPSD